MEELTVDIEEGPRGWRVLLVGPDGTVKPKTAWLGSREAAEAICTRLDVLLDRLRSRAAADAERRFVR